MSQKKQYGYIAISPEGYGGYYGLGDTVDEAKAKMKEEGGTLRRYLVKKLPEGAVDVFIDNFGSVCWTYDEGHAVPDLPVHLETVESRGVKLTA